MKMVSLEEFRDHVDQYLAGAASEDIVLMEKGKPCMLLQAIPDDTELSSVSFARSPEFWAMIQRRRQESGIPWEEAKKQLALDP